MIPFVIFDGPGRERMTSKGDAKRNSPLVMQKVRGVSDATDALVSIIDLLLFTTIHKDVFSGNMLFPIVLMLVTLGANAEETTKSPEILPETEKSGNESEVRVFQNLFNSNMFNPGSVSGMAIMGLAGVLALTQVIPFLMAVFGLALRPDILNLRRSFEDLDWTSDWIKRYGAVNSDTARTEKLVTRFFDRLGVTNLECKKLVVCEMQRHPSTKFGEVGRAMTTLFEHPSITDMDTLTYKHFHEAWKHGNNQEDCSQIYNRCRVPNNTTRK
ncbi:uncharacterized protein [Centruroides vittatus]|uniref:uncharacterized protein n=1 Tax=Centruroides vittatus TaxID=120091 RepID=UPI0035108ED8